MGENVPWIFSGIGNELAKRLLPLLSRLPLLRRFVFKPDKLASKIRIRLRENNPINLDLSAQVPQLSLWFEITNVSSLDVTLDRMLIEMWFGQPNFTGALLRRYSIAPGESVEDIHFTHELTSAQVKQIEDWRNSNGTHGIIYLYLTAYFVWKAGIVEVRRNIERREF